MNKAILLGRLTADPELRYTQGNTAVCKFTLAVDRFMGEGKESQVDFITHTAWGKTAEHISKYYFKGKKALIEGNIKTGSYENQEGHKVYTTEIWVDRIDFADDKKKENQSQSAVAYMNPDDAPPWESPEPTQNPPVAQPSVNNSAPPWMR